MRKVEFLKVAKGNTEKNIKKQEECKMNKVYLKNVNTGAIKTLEEWKEDAIRFFTEQYNEDEELQAEFETVQDYLKWADEQGYFYSDLIECDENGNPVEY